MEEGVELVKTLHERLSSTQDGTWKEPRTKVFIHVGMHKTGTTFLQDEVFPKISDINYQRKVDLTSHVEPNVINLFSDENLDGGSYRLFAKPDDRLNIMLNLKKMFPNTKIIICIRERKSWYLSLWKQYVMSYYGYTYEEYYSKINKEMIDPGIYLKDLFDIFGSWNVLVLGYERLQLDPKGFVKQICEFMEVPVPMFENKPVYKSLSDTQINSIIIFDKIFRSKTLHLVLSLLIRFVRKDPTIKKFMEKKV